MCPLSQQVPDAPLPAPPPFAEGRFATDATGRLPTILQSSMFAILAFHAVVLLFPQPSIAPSRVATAAIPFIAALCCLWRSYRLPHRERYSWRWIATGLALWSAAHLTETIISTSAAASNLAMDKSDFLYLTAAFPLLLALSTTSEIGSIRGIVYLNILQAVLASSLVYLRLFRMPMPAEDASNVMRNIYAAYCVLLAIAATLRLVTWSSTEERRRIRLTCAAIWIYLCIEIAMDYATARWGLRKGTLLDLLWSVPFLFAGWRTLHLPLEEDSAMLPPRARGRKGVLLQSLCPLLITAGVFTLAASIMSRHPVAGTSAMLLLLLIQGLQSAIIQVNYLSGQRVLLEHEQDLKEANAVLEQLSFLDPLTGISNRRHFRAVLDDEWVRSSRKRASLAILMIDVDFFKGVNDLHGHTYGDECLVRIAQVLRGALRRGNDLLARFGGEEFILLLPEANLALGLAIAERMKRAVDQCGMANLASPFDQRLTISIGVSACQAEPSMTPNALIELADKALYQAKHQGRNQICSQESTPNLS